MPKVEQNKTQLLSKLKMIWKYHSNKYKKLSIGKTTEKL